MNNFNKLIEQLILIQEKFFHIEQFLTNTFIEFQREQLEKLLSVLQTKQISESPFESNLNRQVEDTLHDAKYAADRIGVSDKTIFRLTAQGMLPVASYVNRKRQFRKSDIESCRRYYRGD